VDRREEHRRDRREIALEHPGGPPRPLSRFAAPDPERADTGEPTAPGCPAGTFTRYHSSGTGYYLHLGRTRVVVTQCTRVDFATGAGSFADGTITLTAANGDRLVLAQHGTFQLSPWPGFSRSDIDVLDWVVVGGTGRFAHATGAGTGHGFSDDVATPASTTTVWLSGSISY
jgi:hypothetical protein